MSSLPQQASSAAGAAGPSSPRRTLSPRPPQPANVRPQSRLLMGDLSQRRSPWARSLPAPNQPACPAPHTDHTPPALTAPTRCGAAPHRVLAPAACRSGNWAAPFPRLPTATRIERGGGRPCQLGTGIQETRGGGGGISSSPLLLARPEALGLPGTPLARCCRGFPGGQFDSVCGTLSMPADRGSGGRVVWSTPKSHDGTNFVREEYDNGPVL